MHSKTEFVCRFLTLLVGITSLSSTAMAQALPGEWANQITWRSIGPANMGGRITSISVYEKDSSTWWAASASGGLVKTTNNGIDFEHQFDHQATVSIGDVQVCQSNPDIVWVGTGESNPRNSVSYGDGVYKSLDGGKTWENMGLKKTFQIGRIAINPENPDIVYVGALGRLWGPSEDRGLFKTIDGGKTWEKILYVDDKTGVIDIQMNPKNPDELFVATYERLRDNTDDNDPIKRFGEGAGIYRTRDGGKTFERLTQGLPTCKLGRIGLDIYSKNPKYVYAIIESEQIAKAPENQGFAGIRTENADVGARVTSVTKDSPAETSGLKVDDIVVQVDGELIANFEALDNALRRKYAGDKLKLKVAREGEFAELELTLGNVPESRGRRQTGFEGTLGGQIENRQDHQGTDGHEYGGVYLSKDGGDSWTRINSLNPRPMYYSQIRVDPSDSNNLYVLGTSLYRSSDGGEKFTPDGGSDGIHVDHHAMWIDPQNSKHMILGNDGGIYVTYDRMDNWDHLNHIAICQFYHVDVDASPDFRVYGGLQDNGSWGGPNRTGDGGPVNSDWFRVGGGDGFITFADKTDKDQIYFESQNGGMGRINLRTGERGFIRPQAPRGTTYRFNWKTPFLLSPHNSEIFYSAGNFVFRSYSKGDRIEAISEEITNSNKGAGSALSESPIKAGVLYVGTTCGAVWMTKDGGKTWDPLFYQKIDDAPETEQESESGESEGVTKPSSDTSAGQDANAAKEDSNAAQAKAPESTSEQDTKASAEAPSSQTPATGFDGRWKVVFPENAPRFLSGVELVLKVSEDNDVSGTVISARGEREIEDGTRDQESNQITFSVTNQRGSMIYSVKVVDGKLKGKVSANDGRFEMEFTGERIRLSRVSLAATGMNVATLGLVSYQDQESDEKTIGGKWIGVAEGENLPNRRIEFEMNLEMDAKGNITGDLLTDIINLEIDEGHFNQENGKFSLTAAADQISLDFEGVVEGNRMKGSALNVQEQQTVEFSAERMSAPKAADPADAGAKPPAEEMNQDEPAQEAKKPEVETQEAEAGKTSEEKAQQESEAKAGEEAKAAAKPAADDPIAGTWKGKFEGDRVPRGMGEFTFELIRNEQNEVSGFYVNTRGENEVQGKFDPEKKSLNMTVDNERFTITIDATVDGDDMKGTIAFGENFTTEFTARKERPAAEAAAKSNGKQLQDLLPGPRWVSSIEASRYSAGRCYMTFDGHRYDDDEPYLFVTEDYGKSWASLRGNLPATAGVTRVIREDIVNENILYLGCEFSAWVTIDRGANWTKLEGGLPTVAVHDFAQHPTSGELIIGSHGRGVWIADVTPLRQWNAENLKAGAKLYRPNRVVLWRSMPERGDTGPRRFQGENPSREAQIFYSLAESVQQVKLEVKDIRGKTIFEFENEPTAKGLHRMTWNLRSQGGGRGRGFGGLGPGQYMIALDVDGNVQTEVLTIERDPTSPPDARESLTEEEYESILGQDD